MSQNPLQGSQAFTLGAQSVNSHTHGGQGSNGTNQGLQQNQGNQQNLGNLGNQGNNMNQGNNQHQNFTYTLTYSL